LADLGLDRQTRWVKQVALIAPPLPKLLIRG